MDDVSERFLGALSALGHVADAVTSEEAAATLDDAALQLFWREWPQLGSWAATLWRQLNGTWPDHPRPWANRSSTRWVARVAEGRRGPRRAPRRGGHCWLSSPKS
jgi:hypothetical protein